ncbi:MAG: PEP-CTERM sorting domain-containing protein [Pirellulales bacterium]|nr:PEP-CTERM sorting domain-containing protein [Pirellulales bacterium]
MKAEGFFSVVILATLLAIPASATIVDRDDFESYGNQNPAPDPLVGPTLSWTYIDGLGDGALTNQHRTYVSGTGGSAMQSTGWITLEDGGGIRTSASLASLSGTTFDAGGGNIIANAPFQLSFVISAETSDISRVVDFTYDITSPGGFLTFVSGGSLDEPPSTTFTSLLDSGTVPGGSVGKIPSRQFAISFTGSGLALNETIDFSIVRNSGTDGAYFYFDDFLLEALDGVEEIPRLTINRTAGNISLYNATISSVANIIGYSILSASGSLMQTGWDKQAAGSQLANDNDVWTVLTGAGVSTDLSESVLETTGDGNGGDLAAISGGTPGRWDFGNVWIQSPYEDIQLELLLDNGTILTTTAENIAIEYTGDAIAVGDISGAGGKPDGTIDRLDWLTFRGHVGTDVSTFSIAQAYQAGDFNGDLAIGPADYLLFVEAYNAANGAGSFAAMVAGVPEPSSFLMFLSGCCVVLCIGTRRRLLYHPALNHRVQHAMKSIFSTSLLCIGSFLILSNAVVAADYVIIEYDADAGNPPNAAAIQSPLDQGWSEWGATQQGQIHDPALIIQEGIVHNGVNAYRNFDNGPTNCGWVYALSDEVVQAMYDFGWKYELTGVLVQGSHFSAWGVDTDNPWGTGALSRVGIAYGTGDSGGMRVEPVGTGGTNVDLGTGTLNGNFVRAVMIGEAKSLDYTFEIFEHPSGTQIGTAQNMSGFATSPNSLNINVLGLQSGSSPSAGLEALAHLIRLSIPEPATLTLQVNTTNGSMSLVNHSSETVSLNGYFVTSEGGALNPSGWNSLEEQNLDGNGIPDDGIGWEEFDASGNTFLGEGFLTGGSTLSAGASLALGTAFNPSIFGLEQDGDLTFTLTDQDGRQIQSQMFATVEYVTGGAVADADFDNDGDVDGADFLAWQAGFGTAGGPSQGDANGDGQVNSSDLAVWKLQFGTGGASGSGLASAAIPEPAAGFLCLLALALAGTWSIARSCKRQTLTAIVIAGFLALNASAAITVDRDYRLGDDPYEGAVVDDFVGWATGGDTYDSAGTLAAGDAQDLTVHGFPTYIDVTGRPMLSGSDTLGIHFTGTDALYGLRWNIPNEVWDSAAINTNAPPYFPHNYDQIYNTGFQLWVRPSSNRQDVRQDIVTDTSQHGVFITENNTWGFLFDGIRMDTGVAVAFDAWTHVMNRSLSGAFGGALYINGIAVAARSIVYDNEETDLCVGSDQVRGDHFFEGDLDNLTFFTWGDNTGVADGPQGQVGQDWGTIGPTDNAWIAGTLATMGVTDAADVDLDGDVDSGDVTRFLLYWRTTSEVFDFDGGGTYPVGDWNSRQAADLDFNGVVNLADAHMLHEGLTAAGLGGLDYGLLHGGSVPEPGSVLLILLGLISLVGMLQRRKR